MPGPRLVLARPAASFGPGIRTILGDDSRSHVPDTAASPWRMVCHLAIEGPFGSATGSGWLAGPRTVVTAGHCVFDPDELGGMATRIVVSPGLSDGEAPFGTFEATRFVAADAWRQRQDPDFDLGAILLDPAHGRPDPGRALGCFEVAALADDDLLDALVNVSGYPQDKPAGAQQWHGANRITAVTPRRLIYEVDTVVGQSGGPAYVVDRPGAPPRVVGVHAYGIEGAPVGFAANSAPRIDAGMAALIQSWIAAA